jgi:RNA polymerase sigma-70 factor, ECF subfamily
MLDTEQLYEHVLVLRCRTGDEAAFAELVERYHPRLRYYLRQLLREPHTAEDVLQEVWFDVYRSLSRLQNISAFPAWVYKIARCRALREGRKHRLTHQAFDPDDMVDEQGDEASLAAESAEVIHAALRELADEHREILVLRFLEEMSYEDVANVVGCPLGTVASRIHHAKRLLRAILERTTCHE